MATRCGKENHVYTLIEYEDKNDVQKIIIEIWDHIEGKPRIDVKTLKKKLQETWAVRLLQNPKLSIKMEKADGKKISIELPDDIKNRKWVKLGEVSKAAAGVATDEVDRGIYGFIDHDKEGYGEIRIYGSGQYIDSIVPMPKKCVGMIDSELIFPDHSRQGI